MFLYPYSVKCRHLAWKMDISPRVGPPMVLPDFRSFVDGSEFRCKPRNETSSEYVSNLNKSVAQMRNPELSVSSLFLANLVDNTEERRTQSATFGALKPPFSRTSARPSVWTGGQAISRKTHNSGRLLAGHIECRGDLAMAMVVKTQELPNSANSRVLLCPAAFNCREYIKTPLNSNIT